jgi:hypothetical protein
VPLNSEQKNIINSAVKNAIDQMTTIFAKINKITIRARLLQIFNQVFQIPIDATEATIQKEKEKIFAEIVSSTKIKFKKGKFIRALTALFEWSHLSSLNAEILIKSNSDFKSEEVHSAVMHAFRLKMITPLHTRAVDIDFFENTMRDGISAVFGTTNALLIDNDALYQKSEDIAYKYPELHQQSFELGLQCGKLEHPLVLHYQITACIE